MTTATRSEVSQLLAALRGGEKDAFRRLMPLVYEELRSAARHQLRHRPAARTLDTTELVHEAYLRLADQSRPDWHDRHHFLAVSAIAMRQILVDLARRRATCKRGGAAPVMPLEESQVGAAARAEEILALDEALTALDERDERLARVVELRYFLGLSFLETGAVLGITDRTAKRDWAKARAFLYHALHGAEQPPPGAGG